MTALIWRENANGNLSAVIAATPVATVYPRGWWSSYLLGVSLPCASVEDGRAAVEAAWADWMARAGLVWRDEE